MSGSLTGIGALSYSEKIKSLMSVSFNNNDNDNDAQTISATLLSNGDSYSGSSVGNRPDGYGKYVWSDGCEYEGEWRRGIRHGYGKFRWPSGAVYEGELVGGYMHGEGTFIGSDTTSYTGRWRLNLKHGLGYQMYPNGDQFQGSWIQGTPEGPGEYTWANGNEYVGNMKGGKMSGNGVFTWTHLQDSYEGNWLGGFMHGFGVYTWSDGGCYIGTWTRGLKDGKGSFYPKGTRFPVLQELYLNAMRKRGLLPDIRKQKQNGNNASLLNHCASSGDMANVKVRTSRRDGASSNNNNNNNKQLSNGNVLNMEQSLTKKISMDRRWSLEASIEKQIVHDDVPKEVLGTGASNENEIDRNMTILEREYMQGVLISELVLDNSYSASSTRAQRRLKKKLAKEARRPGEVIIKGHRSFDLMLSLQLGIRYTVGKITPIVRREIWSSDYGYRASFRMNFPKGGSQLTPPHQSEDFKWKDYCPMVFRNLREMFNIDTADYMMSICAKDTVRELSSPGKSGSLFFLSQDYRFMIKTLRKSEVKVLLQMLPNYHHHVHVYENTLLTKIFGVHRIKFSSGQKFRFVVTGNIFCTGLRIHKIFDLKGSSLGRSTDKIEIDEHTTLKDLDLNYCFNLEPLWQEALLKQIEIDSKFLEGQRIMDYSLLLGVHYRAPQHLLSLSSFNRSIAAEGLGIVPEEEPMDDNYPQGLVLVPRQPDDTEVVVGPHVRGRPLRRTTSIAGDEEVDLLLPGTARLQIQLGVNMPARAELIAGKEWHPQMFHEVFDVVLYLGIIDILQDYNTTKKIEHAYKSIKFDSLSISAVEPAYYSQRFLDFIKKVLPPECLAA